MALFKLVAEVVETKRVTVVVQAENIEEAVREGTKHLTRRHEGGKGYLYPGAKEMHIETTTELVSAEATRTGRITKLMS